MVTYGNLEFKEMQVDVHPLAYLGKVLSCSSRLSAGHAVWARPAAPGSRTDGCTAVTPRASGTPLVAAPWSAPGLDSSRPSQGPPDETGMAPHLGPELERQEGRPEPRA